MKKIFLFLLICFSFSACSKNIETKELEEQKIEKQAQVKQTWLTQETCNQISGWKWSSDIQACVSKEITEGKGMFTWNGYGTFFGHGNDESPKTKDNPTPEYGTTFAFVDFECVINSNSDTLQKRMELTAKREWTDLLKMLDEGNDLLNPTALAVADCVDGVKDLDFSFFEDAGAFSPTWQQDEVNKRNCYLSGDYRGQNDQNQGKLGLDEQCTFYGIMNANQTWSWKEGNVQFEANSHLPTPWEFKEACGKGEGDAFNFDETDAFIWTSAIGYQSGADWSFGARNLGRKSCEKQNFEDTGAVNTYYGFRVVVRGD